MLASGAQPMQSGVTRNPVRPKGRDHFPEDAHMAPALRRSRDHAPNNLGEAARLWRPIDHELR